MPPTTHLIRPTLSHRALTTSTVHSALSLAQRKSHTIPTVMANESSQSMAEYKQLGKSGLRVSVPILGAMSFGDKRWQNWVIEEDQV